MFSKAKPLKFINIKSEGFDSKLIHLQILKADREDSSSEGRKGRGERERKERKKEGRNEKWEDSVYFRHDISWSFSLVLKKQSHLAILWPGILSFHLHTSIHISLSKQWDAHAIVSFFDTKLQCSVEEFFLVIQGNSGHSGDIFSAKGASKF